MPILGRAVLIMIIGAFPMGIYFFARSGKNQSPTNQAKVQQKTNNLGSLNAAEVEMINKGIEAKAREIKDIDVQILENRGRILRLEGERQSKIKILEDLQIKLSTIIDDVSPTGTSTIR